jgi:hypothetical protein
MTDHLLPTNEAAKYLGGYSSSTLDWWRWKGRGPRYIKIEGRVFYRQSVLDAYLDQNVVIPERDGAAAA